jgi:hypothetical protein
MDGMARFAVVASIGLVLVLALASCSSNQQQSHSLGPAKTSSVQGLPIPEQAQRSGPFVAHVANYLLPQSISRDSVDAWYEKELPKGQPWRSWTPCNHLLFGNGDLTQREWKRGSSSLLMLAISESLGRQRISIIEQDGSVLSRLSC